MCTSAPLAGDLLVRAERGLGLQAVRQQAGIAAPIADAARRVAPRVPVDAADLPLPALLLQPFVGLLQQLRLLARRLRQLRARPPGVGAPADLGDVHLRRLLAALLQRLADLLDVLGDLAIV